ALSTHRTRCPQYTMNSRAPVATTMLPEHRGDLEVELAIFELSTARLFRSRGVSQCSEFLSLGGREGPAAPSTAIHVGLTNPSGHDARCKSQLPSDRVGCSAWFPAQPNDFGFVLVGEGSSL